MLFYNALETRETVENSKFYEVESVCPILIITQILLYREDSKSNLIHISKFWAFMISGNCEFSGIQNWLEY